MSLKEEWKELLSKSFINYEEYDKQEDEETVITIKGYSSFHDDINNGYIGFFADVTFDKNEHPIEFGIWE